MTTLVCFLFCVISVGAVQLDDCQGGYIYITDDTTSPSTIKCSGVATDATVTWYLQKNSQFTMVAQCPDNFCTRPIPDVEAQRFVNSGYSILKITQNHQQVAGGDAVVTFLPTSVLSAQCTIRIIDKLPSVTITGAGASSSVYAGELADLRCRTETLPSLPVTYTWTWTNGDAVNCDTSVTVPGVCRFYVTPQHNQAQVTCDLSYRDYRNIPGKTSTVELNVKYPPPQPPVITGNREVSVGESLTLACRVYSGNPLVTSVNFYCGNHEDATDIVVTSSTDDTSYVSSSVTIQSVQASDNGEKCVCSGNWEKPELYANRSSVTLTVSGAGTAQPPVFSAGTTQPLGQTESEPATGGSSSDINVGAIAGGVVAAVVVVGIVGAVVAIAVRRYLRNRNYARPGPRTDESNYTDLTVYEQVGNNTNNTNTNTNTNNSYANVGISPKPASRDPEAVASVQEQDENYYNTRGLGGSNPENHTYHNEALAVDNTGTYEGLQLSEVGLQNTYTQLAKTKK